MVRTATAAAGKRQHRSFASKCRLAGSQPSDDVATVACISAFLDELNRNGETRAAWAPTRIAGLRVVSSDACRALRLLAQHEDLVPRLSWCASWPARTRARSGGTGRSPRSRPASPTRGPRPTSSPWRGHGERVTPTGAISAYGRAWPDTTHLLSSFASGAYRRSRRTSRSCTCDGARCDPTTTTRTSVFLRERRRLVGDRDPDRRRRRGPAAAAGREEDETSRFLRSDGRLTYAMYTERRATPDGRASRSLAEPPLGVHGHGAGAGGGDRLAGTASWTSPAA